MRLRYAHLPRYGPLRDVAVVFSQEDLLYGTNGSGTGKRRGAINFVVGVNGTGKSSLLRAIYQAFHALRAGELPPFPVTLGWDVSVGDGMGSAVLYHPGAPGTTAYFGVWPQMTTGASAEDWDRVAYLLQPAMPGGKPTIAYASGSDIARSGAVVGHLPTLVAAYTSGSESLWESIARLEMDTDGLAELEAQPTEGERPAGWTLEREWQQNRLEVEGARSDELRQRIETNQILRAERGTETCLFVRDEDLSNVGLLLGIWQAAREMPTRLSEADQEAFRRECLSAIPSSEQESGARRILNRLDWFWPTHLSVTYSDHEGVSRRQREQLLCLCALADEVIRQPSGSSQAVVYLGPIERLDVLERLQNAVSAGSLSGTTEAIARRMSQSRTGAEAFLRLFSEQPVVDGMLMEAFQGLRSWRVSGLLNRLTATVKRLRKLRPGATLESQQLITSVPDESGSDSSPEQDVDDAIIPYDSFSDGEQALLSRMALLFLLRGQENSLLLLDEPETHFNDVWKREIVDLVDDNVLKTTAAQVVIATHTSIALTDVFSSEITRLVNRDGHPVAEQIAFPTFGADPGRLLLHVFGAPDIIGARAAEFLRERLAKQWIQQDRVELERLVNEIGAGWPRAKLAELLAQLDASQSP